MDSRGMHQLTAFDLWDPFTEFFSGYLMGMMETARRDPEMTPIAAAPHHEEVLAAAPGQPWAEAASVREPEGRVGLVVHPDPEERRKIHLQLVDEGFESVMTCAGPDHVDCPAIADPPRPCAKLASRVDRAVVSGDYGSCGLLDNYREQQPIFDVVVHTGS